MNGSCEVFKAQRTVQDVEIPDLHISGTFEMPSFGPDYAEKAPLRFDEQGKRIVDAMLASLPGGTVDAVLRHLLLHRASLLVVRL